MKAGEFLRLESFPAAASTSPPPTSAVKTTASATASTASTPSSANVSGQTRTHVVPRSSLQALTTCLTRVCVQMCISRCR